MSTLARQGAATGKPWSLTRDNQTRTMLEAGLDAALGRGVTWGGRITKTAALAVAMEVSTELFAEGSAYTTDASTPVAYSGFGNGTVRIWGLVGRTAANQLNQADSDVPTLTLTHTTDDTTAPSALHIPLSVLTVSGGDILRIDDPPGKYLERPGLGAPSVTQAGEFLALNAGRHLRTWGDIELNGRFVVSGHWRADAWE